jgi:hypothetical protein
VPPPQVLRTKALTALFVVARGRAGRLGCRKTISCHMTLRSDFGAVAQLGERYNGIVEVRGSIPLGSTIPDPCV